MMEDEQDSRELDCPSDQQLIDWLNSGVCEATDGCCVEPDGICEHGCESWLLKMNLI